MGLMLGRFLDAASKKIVNLATGTAASDAANTGQVTAARDFAVSRANHTGSQLAATISDFDATVRSSRLDQLAGPTGPVGLNGQRLVSLADGVANSDAATVGQLNTAISGVTGGLNFKGSVRAAVGANVTLSAPGAALDGLTPAVGDVFLLYGQTNAAQNGPWVWQGASATMTRPANFDSSAEALLGSFWVVRESGTTYKQGDSFAIMANDTAVTLGTTALTFIFINPAGGAVVSGVVQDVGGATTVQITHALGTRDVFTEVYRNSSPWDTILTEVQRPTIDRVDVVFDAAPAAAEFRVMVRKAVSG